MPPVSSRRTRRRPRAGPSRGSLAARARDELGDLLGAQARRGAAATTPSERRRSTSAAEQRLGDLGLGVAERGDHQRARLRRAAREVAQQQQRRRVGPVPVLDHEQQRRARAPAAASRSATALWRRWRSVSGSAATGGGASSPTRSGRSGSSRASSPPSGPRSPRAASPASISADELVERLDERPVRAPHDRVAGAVEHQRAVCRGLVGELAHQAALARSRLAADQREPEPLVRRPRGISAAQRGRSSRARPANGNDGVRRSGPGSLGMSTRRRANSQI